MLHALDEAVGAIARQPMRYFCIDPEVAGGLGRNTLMDRSVHPPKVSKLHYHFEGWLGDALLEAFPCFIVTETAKCNLESVDVSGVTFESVEIGVSEQFRRLYPDRQLPRFAWLRVEGQPAHEDFGIAADGRLVVSQRALEVLRDLGISHALIADFPNEFVDSQPGLSETDFAWFKKETGLTLPPDVRAHYSKYNGGQPRDYTYVLGDAM